MKVIFAGLVDGDVWVLLQQYGGHMVVAVGDFLFGASSRFLASGTVSAPVGLGAALVTLLTFFLPFSSSFASIFLLFGVSVVGC